MTTMSFSLVECLRSIHKNVITKKLQLNCNFLGKKVKSRGSSRNLGTEGFNGLDQPGKIGVAVENA